MFLNTETLMGIMQIVVPSVVTIVSLVIAFTSAKKSIRAEIEKQKMNLWLEKVDSLPMEVLNYIYGAMEQRKSSIAAQQYQTILEKVLAYGSSEAILIIASIRELMRDSDKNEEQDDKGKIIAHFVLLLCQLKYDISDIKTNPSFWYRIYTSDFSKQKQAYKKMNNEIVSELELADFLEIK